MTIEAELDTNYASINTTKKSKYLGADKKLELMKAQLVAGLALLELGDNALREILKASGGG